MKSYNPCRFGFNGKEKLDEITGNKGTDYDFGARLYDARVGRWWSVDKYSSKFSFNSPYSFVSVNPVVALDKGGDSTIYYSENGRLLFVSHDNLDNALVVVSDKNLMKFARNGLLAMKFNQEHTDNANITLRMSGKEYVISDFLNWSIVRDDQKIYNSNGEVVYKHEKSSYNYDFNGRIKPGNHYAVGEGNFVTSLDRDNAGLKWEGSVSTIHDHPNAGEDPRLKLGPNSDYKEHINDNIFLDVCVEHTSKVKNIYFYNNKSISIKIDPGSFNKTYNIVNEVKKNIPLR